MPGTSFSRPKLYTRISSLCHASRSPASSVRGFASLSHLRAENPASNRSHGKKQSDQETKGEEGAMSRRLSDMTEQSLEEGGRSARKAVNEAGFSEELKRQLEDRIAGTDFRNENASAFAQANLPSSAGKGTQQIATSQPWTGAESTEDAALRMLTDAYKPMKVSPRIPKPRGMPNNVDLRLPKTPSRSAGERLANARDKTSIYSLSQDNTMTEQEKEAMRKQLKERFTPGARPMPTSIQGLASLANERIEDAIARGQFKNISRGKGIHVERDYNASSPFLDTTEYFMNKIIQKQEIVPPWIEKQQELVKAAMVFRSRLRSDWKRHAARVIASQGGPLQAQIERAKAYAAAEKQNNSKTPKVEEALSEIDHEGRISRIKLEETTPTETFQDSDPTITTILKESVSETSSPSIPNATPPPTSNNTTTPKPKTPPSSPSPSLPHFRDPLWQSTELPYHTLAITSLNTLTRSYNLMAPSLAKKPYFSLDRELKACFADVAPLLAEEIGKRATRLKGNKDGGRGVLERFGGGGEKGKGKVRVFDERRPRYGFREFWKDLWG
ncbi:MAG: hypothetical protein M1834_003197 [Cirrosporium novae-zelandiae]|nr:MAG: hypothetical protein M1834_003197 [Cirrosporium novae-zelandiae]